MELPMSYCLNAVKMEARTLSKAKGYPSVLDMTLSDSRMDRATLDAMLTAIREYLPHFRRYMKAKAKLLGHQNGRRSTICLHRSGRTCTPTRWRKRAKCSSA